MKDIFTIKAKLGLASPLLLLTSKLLSSVRHKVNQPFLIIIVYTEISTLTNAKYTEIQIPYFTKQESRAISADTCVRTLIFWFWRKVEVRILAGKSLTLQQYVPGKRGKEWHSIGNGLNIVNLNSFWAN